MADSIDTTTTASLPYEEPSISTLLILTSFLILLNTLNHLLNATIYCGLIAQILLGVAFGSPGAKWLSTTLETTISNIGYIGLILIVYEGGLSTQLPALRANLGLASRVAVTGIATPITLSFMLKSLAGASNLQAFAAGAALCSTSLGTTFAVLQATGLDNSRLGVVLTAAAMMDDVVGLVMVQVIASLGGSQAFGVATVLRPVGVSIAFAVLVPLACWVINKLGIVRWSLGGKEGQTGRIWMLVGKVEVMALMHCLFLLAMVAAGSYAGTSNLFTAYLAGVSVNWWDNARATLREELKNRQPKKTLTSKTREPDNVADMNAAKSHSSDKTKTKSACPTHNQANTSTSRTRSTSNTSSASASVAATNTIVQRPETPSTAITGLDTYHKYLAQPVNRILKPFFFASIGFSIPISQMFSGSVVWRGIVYTVLMLVGKLVCGVWLLRFNVPGTTALKSLWYALFNRSRTSDKPKDQKGHKNKEKQSHISQSNRDHNAQAEIEMTKVKSSRGSQPFPQHAVPDPASASTAPAPDPPLSLYPSLILGSAMVARGEIGFLISALAESRGIFATPSTPNNTRNSSQDIFLVVTWAIMLCTIIGPVSVGLFVKRVRRLEKGKGPEGARGKDVLGAWGVN